MTPPTLRSERRERFVKILRENSVFGCDHYEESTAERFIIEVAEKLADASLSRTERQQEEKPDVMDGILESEKLAQIERAALLAFEAAFKIENGNIPWHKNRPEWTRLRKKLVEKHQSDPEYFKKYAVWQKSDGKYVTGSSPQKMRQDPDGFLLALDAYEAGSEVPQNPRPEYKKVVTVEEEIVQNPNRSK